jgi:N-methylhydantoinase A
MARLLHGTTVATNTAIERKGARTVGIFTHGFRHTLAIGTAQRFAGGLFDPRFAKPQPLVPNSRCLDVEERIDYRGKETAALEAAELDRLPDELRRLNAESVAVCLLHSYANDTHERAIEDRLRHELPGLFVCRSSDVHPQIREFERFTTTTFNAYLGPVVERYLVRLRAALEARGYQDELLLMASNGGVISATHAMRYPVKAVLSGPAGGVSAGLLLGRLLGLSELITYDMGGTSTDVCLVKDHRASLATQRVISGLPLRIPQLDINTIGAGGGSVAVVERDGTFRVGPESAGAVPGPACYARGGEQPTVTDANVVLGRLGRGALLGGVLPLRADLANRAVDGIRSTLGFANLETAAEGLLRIAVSNMAGAIREISVERGEDPRQAALVAFGGAGAMHGCEVAEELGMQRVVVPLFPGNFAALGLLVSDERHEFIRTHLALLGEADLSAIRRALYEMEALGRQALSPDRFTREVLVEHAIEMRFLGQAHGLQLRVQADDLQRDRIDAAFRRLYEQTWNYQPEGPLQLVSLQVTVVGRAPALQLTPPNQLARASIDGALKERREVFMRGRWQSTPIYERGMLPMGANLSGPLIIDEEGGTTVVPPGWTTEVHPTGHLFIWPQ